MNLIRPIKKYINDILATYKGDYFSEPDGVLILIFKTFPKNDDYHQILAKVVILNKLYATNILNPYPVAKHIYNLSIDNDLSNGIIDIVEKIAWVKFQSGKRYLYSFATKYCSWHYPEKYFIYDSYIDSILWEYKKKFKFDNYKRLETRNYKKFFNICSNFMRFFNLEDISKKNLDEFLWLESKRFYGEI